MTTFPPERSGTDAQDDWAAAHGLRDSSARPCPRVVAGLRCVDRWGNRCVCQSEPIRDVFDHTRIWLAEDGRHVLTTEPYTRAGLDRDIDTLRSAISDLALTVTVFDDSPWNPGETVLIAISQAANPLPDIRTTKGTRTMTEQQAHWRYTAGTWQPIDDPAPGDPWEDALENAGYFASAQPFGFGDPKCFVVYHHRTEDRWLIEINITGDVIRLVEVTSFPDLVDLTVKLAPLATAEVLTGVAADLGDVIDIAREDADRETRRRRPARRS